jgi:hypothetical protein
MHAAHLTDGILFTAGFHRNHSRPVNIPARLQPAVKPHTIYFDIVFKFGKNSTMF